MVKHLFGKSLDVTKLKSNVLSNLTKHIEKIRFMMGELSSTSELITQKTCFICGSEHSRPFSEVYGFKYVECTDCSHVYTQTRYRDADIIQFYTNNATYSEVTYANVETCYYRRDSVAKPKFDFVIDHLPFKPSTFKWLDVGCGIGDLVSVANQNNWHCMGLELSSSSIAFSKEIFKQDLIQKTLEDFCKTSKERFEVVSFIGVLEHVTSPMDHLRMARKILEDNGLVLIQVPNAMSMATYTQDIFPETVFRHMSPVEHIMLFSEESLEKALRETGFESIAYWWHGLDSYEILNQMTMHSKKDVSSSRFNQAWMKVLSELQFVFDQNKLSDRILCLARRV